MADKGIIFSAPMVRALLDGRKTQTRRLLKPQPIQHVPDLAFSWGRYHGLWPDDWFGRGNAIDEALPYAPGDRLYVREAWGTWGIFNDLAPSKLTGKEGIAYAADYSDPHGEICGRLRPSIHMPRWASRLTLLVTDVRVQRVADISEEDAEAEGAEYGYGQGAKISQRRMFELLWNSLHTKPGERWEDNPWIVAVSFTVQHSNIDRIGE